MTKPGTSTSKDTSTGKVILDLNNMNLTPEQLAQINRSLCQIINSVASPLNTTETSFAAPDNDDDTDDENDITDVKNETTKTKSRASQARRFLVPAEELIKPDDIPGTLLNLDESTLNAMVHDNESALQFAAKYGLIPNSKNCPKCSREMALCKFNNPCGFRWVCRRSANKQRYTCSVFGMRTGTILDERLFKLGTMIRMIYLFSKSVPEDEIFERLEITRVRNAKSVLQRLNAMTDREIIKIAGRNAPVKVLKEGFFDGEGIDVFGFLISWGAYSTFDKAEYLDIKVPRSKRLAAKKPAGSKLDENSEVE